MQYKMILDTETTGVEARFIYDIGFIIVNEKYEVIQKMHYVVKQTYDNRELFMTSYYGNKKPIYTQLLRRGKAKKEYLGRITQKMAYLIRKYNITKIYAYNAPFDKKAFEFTTKFYRVKNPLENLQFVDIMKVANNLHKSKEYETFAKNNKMKTKTGRTKKTAETTYAFIINNPDYKEQHMGLHDCEIELEILKFVAM